MYYYFDYTWLSLTIEDYLDGYFQIDGYIDEFLNETCEIGRCKDILLIVKNFSSEFRLLSTVLYISVLSVIIL